jgi:hypothetical protein
MLLLMHHHHHCCKNNLPHTKNIYIKTSKHLISKQENNRSKFLKKFQTLILSKMKYPNPIAATTLDDLSFLLSNLLFEQASDHPKLLPKRQTQNLLSEIEIFPTQF